MQGGFAPRFALEAAFLILVGVGAGYADLRTVVIVGLLAGGWVLVSLVELVVWRSQARPVAAYVPPPQPPGEPEDQLPAEAAAAAPEPESESEQEAGEYPLRAGAGDAPSAEVEAYTRILGGAEPDDLSGEAAE